MAFPICQYGEHHANHAIQGSIDSPTQSAQPAHQSKMNRFQGPARSPQAYGTAPPQTLEEGYRFGPNAPTAPMPGQLDTGQEQAPAWGGLEFSSRPTSSSRPGSVSSSRACNRDRGGLGRPSAWQPFNHRRPARAASDSVVDIHHVCRTVGGKRYACKSCRVPTGIGGLRQTYRVANSRNSSAARNGPRSKSGSRHKEEHENSSKSAHWSLHKDGFDRLAPTWHWTDHLRFIPLARADASKSRVRLFSLFAPSAPRDISGRRTEGRCTLHTLPPLFPSRV